MSTVKKIAQRLHEDTTTLNQILDGIERQIPEKEASPQVRAARKHDEKMGLAARTYKLKADESDAFKEACTDRQESQASVLTRLMAEYVNPTMPSKEEIETQAKELEYVKSQLRRLTQAENNLTTMDKQATRQKGQLEQASSTVSSLYGEAKEIENALKENAAQISEQIAYNKKLAADIANLENEAEGLKSKINDMKAILGDKERLIAESEAIIAEQRKLLEQAKASTKEHVAALEVKDRHIAEQAKQLERANAKITELEALTGTEQKAKPTIKTQVTKKPKTDHVQTVTGGQTTHAENDEASRPEYEKLNPNRKSIWNAILAHPDKTLSVREMAQVIGVGKSTVGDVMKLMKECGAL